MAAVFKLWHGVHLVRVDLTLALLLAVETAEPRCSLGLLLHCRLRVGGLSL